jgi:uncharacterized protein YceK
MRQLAVLALALAACAASTGCGTCATLAGKVGYIQEAGIYSGVRFDVQFVFGGKEVEARAAILKPFFFLDMPLSLAIDTLLLPVTIPIEIVEASRDYGEEWRGAIEAGDRALRDGAREEADRQYADAYRIACMKLGMDDPRIRQTRERQLALCAAETERARQESGVESRPYADRLIRQASLLRSLGRDAEAKALQSEARAIQERAR